MRGGAALLGIVFGGLALALGFITDDATLESVLGDDNAVTPIGKVEQKAPQPNSAQQIAAKPQVPVLCYHRITDSRKSSYAVGISTFANQIKMLADSGYHSISPTLLYEYLVHNKPLPNKPVMLTFDDSRAEHALIAAPLLEKYHFRGVFFIMTITNNKKNYLTKTQIRSLSDAGHTIGLHSWDHTMVTKYRSEHDWETQVVKPKMMLEKLIGKPIECWAFPNGVYSHSSAERIGRYFKMSFILAEKRDTALPLQTVRRVLVPSCSPKALLRTMQQSFSKRTTKHTST